LFERDLDGIKDPEFLEFVYGKLFIGFGSGSAGSGALEITLLAVPIIIFGVDFGAFHIGEVEKPRKGIVHEL
jgi:hypothetical protein